MNYAITLTPDDNGTVLVSFPDFPEAHTFGADEADAKRRAIDALETVIMAYMKDRRTIPAATRRTTHIVRLPATMAAKVMLYTAMLERKITKYALGKTLNIHQPQVDRLFDLRHRSQLDQLEAAAHALGRELTISVSKIPGAKVAPAKRRGRPRTQAHAAAAHG